MFFFSSAVTFPITDPPRLTARLSAALLFSLISTHLLFYESVNIEGLHGDAG